MKSLHIALMVVSVSLPYGSLPASADDAVVNTPTIIAALKGEWELQTKTQDEYRQRLSFDGSRCGEWQQRPGTLPMTITFYIEGNELLLQHYYEPMGAFNYRLKQLRYRYKLEGETLTLMRNDDTATWKRIKRLEPK